METIFPNVFGCAPGSFTSFQERTPISCFSASVTAIRTRLNREVVVTLSSPLAIPAWKLRFKALRRIITEKRSFSFSSFCLQLSSVILGIQARSSSEPARIITGGLERSSAHTSRNILENSSRTTSLNVRPKSLVMMVKWQISTRINIPWGYFPRTFSITSIPGFKR